MEWIKCSDRLPDKEYCYLLVVRKYHAENSPSHVMHTFFTKDRELARDGHPHYSRKIQGKDSVHFECAEPGFIVTHWMPLPEPPSE